MTNNLESVETITTTAEQPSRHQPSLDSSAEWMFFRRWLKSPLSVASITPSSNTLARGMVDAIPRGAGIVVELGAGTGAITTAFLQSGCAPEDIVIVERDLHFCEFLNVRYPAIKVIHGDALNLKHLLTNAGIIPPVRAVVSGLPLLAMPTGMQESLLRQVFDVVGASAPLIQFSYSLFSPLKKSVQDKFALEAHCAQHIWRNVPPAKVWRYRRATTMISQIGPVEQQCAEECTSS